VSAWDLIAGALGQRRGAWSWCVGAPRRGGERQGGLGEGIWRSGGERGSGEGREGQGEVVGLRRPREGLGGGEEVEERRGRAAGDWGAAAGRWAADDPRAGAPGGRPPLGQGCALGTPTRSRRGLGPCCRRRAGLPFLLPWPQRSKGGGAGPSQGAEPLLAAPSVLPFRWASAAAAGSGGSGSCAPLRGRGCCRGRPQYQRAGSAGSASLRGEGEREREERGWGEGEGEGGKGTERLRVHGRRTGRSGAGARGGEVDSAELAGMEEAGEEPRQARRGLPRLPPQGSGRSPCPRSARRRVRTQGRGGGLESAPRAGAAEEGCQPLGCPPLGPNAWGIEGRHREGGPTPGCHPGLGLCPPLCASVCICAWQQRAQPFLRPARASGAGRLCGRGPPQGAASGQGAPPQWGERHREGDRGGERLAGWVCGVRAWAEGVGQRVPER